MTAATAVFRHRQLDLAGSSIHVVEAGDPRAAPVLFLHGWPQDWSAWHAVMALAAREFRAVAIDLPGIGGSTSDTTDGSKRPLAAVVRRLIAALETDHPTIVAHDAGGMVAYAYLRSFPDLDRAVIMDTVIPGVDPWDDVLRNPHFWHFAQHSIPKLPERLVRGREREYFDYFFDVLSPDPSTITPAARAGYVHAYARDTALHRRIQLVPTLTRDGGPCALTRGARRLTTPPPRRVLRRGGRRHARARRWRGRSRPALRGCPRVGCWVDGLAHMTGADFLVGMDHHRADTAGQ